MLEQLCQIAAAAGRETLRFYGQPLTVEAKADDSPLTQADLASHRYIVEQLRVHFPEIAIVSEEDGEHQLPASATQRCFIVDPLDGTKEFIKQTGAFTVNIGLVENGLPVAGIVHAPATGLTYGADASGAWKAESNQAPQSINSTTAPDQLRIVASRDHAGPEVAALLKRFPEAECLSIGSSLKFCLVAEGAADIYLRDVPTMEWDTAAAQAIVEAAGGVVLNHPDHTPLAYGKTDYRNGSLLTLGREATLQRLA